MSKILIYKIPGSLSDQALVSEFSKKFSILQSPPGHYQQMFFDTFDWRLFNNGSTLIRENNEYILNSLLTGQSIEKSNVKFKHQPKFWWDFPDGSLKESLKKHLNVRALLPLAEIEIKRISLRILNEDKKTVLRIEIENCCLIQQAKKNTLVNALQLLPVKGYDREFEDVNSWLKDQGVTEQTRPFFFLALAAVGKKAGEYSSKLNITLQPDMIARDATKIILQFLLNVIKANIEGMKADIDTEFLHDFRVAIRRTRSALSQIRGVFPKDIRNQFKGDFAVLQKASNHLRDLDVYLLNKEKYQQMLPEHLRPGLDQLFKQVHSERNAELKKIIKVLNSNSFHKLIESWEEFLNSQTDQPETKNSQKPVIELACKFISKTYARIINAGAKITAESPSSEFHQLRIECKKLRYLLEFFSSLFPEEEISLLIKQLKKLQDNLGDYNDLTLQQRSLKKYLENITSEDEDSLQISSAMGGLIAGLYQHQQKIRSEFAQTYAEFSGQDNGAIYIKLFGKKQK